MSKGKEEPRVETRPKPQINKLGTYVGSRITAENRRAFMEKQKERYREHYEEQLEKGEIEEPWTEERLERVCEEYARVIVNRENKHYKAYLKGKKFYTYKGRRYPVATDIFLRHSQSLKEQMQRNESRKLPRQEIKGSGDTSGVSESSESGISETKRPDTDTKED